MKVPILSFNAGEIAPEMYARIDFEKYPNAASQLKNMVIQPQGPICVRPGTRYIDPVKDPTSNIKLIPFVFSDEQSYILEVSPGWFKFYADDGVVQRTSMTNSPWITGTSYSVGDYVKHDASHKLQLSFETDFSDSSPSGHVVTNNGAVIDNISKLHGKGAVAFDGSASYLTIPDHADFAPVGNCTFHFWMMPLDLTPTINQVIFYHYDAGALVYHYCTIQGTSLPYIRWRYAGGGFGGAIDSNHLDDIIAVGKWSHVRIMRRSDVWYMYVDDILVGQGNATGAQVTDCAGLFYIGCAWDGATTFNHFNGYLDEFTICHDDIDTIVGDEQVQKYRCIYAHTSGAGNEPGVGASWDTYWEANNDLYVVNPYSSIQIPGIRFAQFLDIINFAHEEISPFYISRYNHDYWEKITIDDLYNEDVWPPFDDLNTTSETMDASALTGNITITRSVGGFTTFDIGRYMRMHDGYAKITGITSGTIAQATVIKDFTAHTATEDWAWGAWDQNVFGWPRYVTYHENRLFWAGNKNEPLRIWGSIINDYYNHLVQTWIGATLLSTDGVYRTLASGQQQDKIVWLASAEDLYAGTLSGEFIISGSTENLSISPASWYARAETKLKSKNIDPILVGTTLIFVQKEGKKLYDWKYVLEYDKKYGFDLTLLVPHFFRDYEIEQIVFQENPLDIVWVRRADGKLFGITYVSDQKIWGWFKAPIAGPAASAGEENLDAEVIDMAVVPGTDGTEVWMAVKRKINQDNLVINGDMELDSNWNDYGGVFLNIQSQSTVIEGKYSRSFTVNGTAQGIQSDTFSLIKGKRYKLSFWVYPSTKTTIYVYLRNGDDSATDVSEYAFGLVPEKWEYVEYIFIASATGSDAYIRFDSQIESSGTWFIDDVKVTLADNVYIERITDFDFSEDKYEKIHVDSSLGPVKSDILTISNIIKDSICKVYLGGIGADELVDDDYIQFVSLSGMDELLMGGFNCVRNGSMETNCCWNDEGTPTVNAQSSDQAHGGTYSRKFTVNAALEGIKSNSFSTITGRTYAVTAWVYPDDTTNIQIKRRKGSGASTEDVITKTDLVQDAWNEITATFVEDAGGSSAEIIFISPSGVSSGTWYIDDVSVIDQDDEFTGAFKIDQVGLYGTTFTIFYNDNYIDSQDFTDFVSGTARQVWNSISGLDHLENAYCLAIVDGFLPKNVQVLNGSITLPDSYYAHSILVGLRYHAEWTSLDIHDVQKPLNQHLVKKSVINAILNYKQSLTFEIAPLDTTDTDLIEYVQDVNDVFIQELETMVRQCDINGDFDWQSFLHIISRNGLPLTLISLNIEVDTE